MKFGKWVPSIISSGEPLQGKDGCMKYQVILASGSPRRKELLELIGVDFNIIISNKEEIIVDNEDSALFTLSVPPPSGYLEEWINKNSEEESFKYVGINEWRSPARWTMTTDQNYYGESIRSAAIIRSGKGNQYAEWKIPVPSAGRYELYYHVRRPEQLRRENRWGRKKYYYHFVVTSEADDYEAKAEINMRRADDGWNLIDTYGLIGDTLVVRLTDESELNMITADAVKLVKK
jgi:hypothetical protein